MALRLPERQDPSLSLVPGKDQSSSVESEALETQISDQIGVLVSGACALHCALVPVLLTLLPAAGVALGDERVEWGLLGLAGLVASWSLLRGYRFHRSKWVASFLVTGLATLIAARLIEQWSEQVVVAALVSVLGAGLLIAGHLQNLRLSRV